MTQEERNRAKTKRYVNGKTLHEIAEMFGIAYGTINERYCKGERTWEEITRPIDKSHTYEWRIEEMTNKGRRLLNAMNDKGITLKIVSQRTGINRNTIAKFMYYDTDISSMRLAKICEVVGLSMDYVMGLKR